MKPDPAHIKLAERLFHNGRGIHSSIAEEHMGDEHWDKLSKDVGVDAPKFTRARAISHLKALEDAHDVVGTSPEPLAESPNP